MKIKISKAQWDLMGNNTMLIKQADEPLIDKCYYCGQDVDHDDGYHDHEKDVWLCPDCYEQYIEDHKNRYSIKVPFFFRKEDAQEVANYVNQGWSHRSNGSPHVLLEKKGNGFVVRPNWEHFLSEKSPAWQDAIKSSLELNASLIDYLK